MILELTLKKKNIKTPVEHDNNAENNFGEPRNNKTDNNLLLISVEDLKKFLEDSTQDYVETGDFKNFLEDSTQKYTLINIEDLKNYLILEKKNDRANSEAKDENVGYSYIIIFAIMALHGLVTLMLFLRIQDLSKQRKDLNKQRKEGGKLNGSNTQKEDLEARISTLENELTSLKNEFNARISTLENNLNALSLQEARNSAVENKLQAVNSNSKIPEEIKTSYIAPPLYNAKKNLDLQESPKIINILTAFNKMMNEVSKKNNYDGMDIRREFAEKYKVIAFKCINAEARASHSENPPVFKECDLFDGTLWGIPLNDGTLAVFPNLSSYESAFHFKGGMKELFNSNYAGGNYRKIDVKQPAVLTRDLKIINQKGKLELS